MAKPSNPLGTSTGIGKGEAQVFGSTYNSIFKDKLAQAEKKDKELKDAMSKASDMSQLWSRDVAAFKPMVNEYQNFVRENARALIKGDFDATVKNQQMMNNLTQYASSSKEAQKFYNDSLKAMRDHPNMYYDKDESKLMDFGASTHSGDFDYSKYGLRPKMDVTKITDNLKANVQKFGTIPGGLSFVEKKNDSGEVIARYLIDSKGNKRADLNELVDNAIINSKRDFGEPQASEKLNDEWRESTLKELKNYLKDERIVKNLGMGSSDSSGGTPETQVFEFNPQGTSTQMNTVYGRYLDDEGVFDTDYAAGTIGYNPGDVMTFNPLEYEASITFRGTPSSEAVPIGGGFLTQQYNAPNKNIIEDKDAGITKDQSYIGGVAESGNSFVYDDLKKGFKSGRWEVQKSMLINAFPKEYTTASGANVGGAPIDNQSIESDRFKNNPKGGKPEKRYYVALENSQGQRVLEPYWKARKVINQQYKSSKDSRKRYNEWYEKTKQFLIDNGYSAAYKDFTNQEMPSSSKTKTKGGKQLDPNEKGISPVEKRRRQAIIDKQ